MFDRDTSKVAGKRGGEVKTAQKARAARVNGRMGGRPSSRNLSERLLNRAIAPAQEKYVKRAWEDLFEREKYELRVYFQLSHLNDGVDLSVWKSKSRRMPKEIKYIVLRFKLAANLHMKDLPAPKSYVIEWRQRSAGEQDAWERKHRDTGIPCPPHKVKVDVRNLPYFSLFELNYRNGTLQTVQEIVQRGGSQWTAERAKTALAWLEAEHHGKKNDAHDKSMPTL
jgi:hypothetical protein